MTDTKNDLISCVLCGGDVVRRSVDVPVELGARPEVLVRRGLQQCVECGEVYYAAGEMDEVHLEAATVARTREGLLTPAEIRSIRESMNLTQAQLERLLRVGPKTVVRWERGTVFQNRTTDTLLRALRDLPPMREYLLGTTPEPVAARASIFTVTLEHPIAPPVAVPARSAQPWLATPQWTPLVDADVVEPDGAERAA